MSQSNEKDGEGSQNDEFDFYIQFTKPLVLDLPTPEDRAIAAAWVQKLEAEPQTEEEKRLRLDYLKLLLFVLQRGRLSGIFKKQPAPGSLQPFPQGFSMADMGNLMIDRDEIQTSGGGDTQSVPYTIEISSDLREFVAAQEVPNFGVQMYYAWSSNEAIHKWSLFDEDKFPSYILEKIKQLKDDKSDDKTRNAPCRKKPCDLPLGNYTKTKVKSPEEIEKAQGRSYQTYVGLVGRMGGSFKDVCDDDQDKYPGQDQRKPRSKKKCGETVMKCSAEQEEEYDNFLTGLSGHNSTPTNCKCPHPYHRPDCEAHGKGVQPFEERNRRSISPNSKPESGGCNVWASPGAGGNRGLNTAMGQFGGGSQFSQVASGQQRSTQSPRSVSPYRNDELSATGNACKSPNRMSMCACPSPPCTCPCPRSRQQDVPRAAVGPSPTMKYQGSGGRTCRNRSNGPQRPAQIMFPQDSLGHAGGSCGEASGPPNEPLHCYGPQYDPCSNKQTGVKINNEEWCPEEEFNCKPQEDDRRSQKIANLGKIIAKEAREEDDLDEAFSSRQYKGPHASSPNKWNSECPQICASSAHVPPQPPCKMRGSVEQGKMRQQQPQAENIRFDCGAPPPPPSSNSCHSGGYQKSFNSPNNFCQSSCSGSPQYKQKPRANTETLVKSLAYSPQNQVQCEERQSYQHARPNVGGADGMNSYPMSQKAEVCNKFQKSMNSPMGQSNPCQSGRLFSPNNNSGRLCDMENVLEGIKMKTEAHREKCQSATRRSQVGEPNNCSKSPKSRPISPFQGAPNVSCQSPPPPSRYQSQPQSPGKSCPEAMGGGMIMSGEYADYNTSRSTPNAWSKQSEYCPPQGNRQLMNCDVHDLRKEGSKSPGKGICNSGASSHLQSSGVFRSPKIYQGPPISTFQGTPPPNCQGSPPPPCQGLPPPTCQGPPPPTCQPEDDYPCDEEDEDNHDSCSESLDECPQGSSSGGEFFDNSPCDDVQRPQQWPESSARRTGGRAKECVSNVKNKCRKKRMVCSSPIQSSFPTDESSIPFLSPSSCNMGNMGYQYDQECDSYNGPQQPNQEAEFYPIFGNSDECGYGGQPQQSFGGFMELQNRTQGSCNTTSNRRRMLEAPLPDQFSLGESQNEFNTCNKSGY